MITRLRKGAIFSLIVGLQLNTAAQITLTQTDLPNIGDTIVNAVDTLPVGITVGGTGSQTWDFSNLNVHNLLTTYVVDPTTTPGAAFFPNSELAVEGVGNTTYLSEDATSFVNDGFYGDPTGFGFMLGSVNTPARTMLELPYSSPSSFQDTSFSLVALGQADFVGTLLDGFVDSLVVHRYEYIVSTTDAYGDITTPAGTYTSLRQHNILVAVDSIFGISQAMGVFPNLGLIPENFLQLAGIASNPRIDSSFSYSWYASGETWPVARVETDAAGTVEIVSFKIGDNLVSGIPTSTSPLCVGECTGTATAEGISGLLPYSFIWDAAAGMQTTQTATGLCAGTYDVTVIDAAGDSASASVSIIDPTPISITVNNITPTTCDTCPAGLIEISASGGAGGFSYLWSDGQTNPAATGLVEGTYSVTVTDGNGCVDSLSTAVPVGLTELKLSSFVKVFPNPSNGFLTIKSNGINLKNVEVYNINGAIVQNNVLKQNATLNLQELENGTYLLKIRTEKGVLTKKVNLVR